MRKAKLNFYILRDMKPVQASLEECQEWWEHRGDANIVESTPVMMMNGEHVVETIFTGIGPYLYKTYLKPGILKPQHYGSYRTLGAAKIGHREVLDQLFDTSAVFDAREDDF